jgi:hypothetical protein
MGDDRLSNALEPYISETRPCVPFAAWGMAMSVNWCRQQLFLLPLNMHLHFEVSVPAVQWWGCASLRWRPSWDFFQGFSWHQMVSCTAWLWYSAAYSMERFLLEQPSMHSETCSYHAVSLYLPQRVSWWSSFACNRYTITRCIGWSLLLEWPTLIHIYSESSDASFLGTSYSRCMHLGLFEPFRWITARICSDERINPHGFDIGLTLTFHTPLELTA